MISPLFRFSKSFQEKTMHILAKWLVGGVFSTMAIWGITAVFSDSIPLEEWSAPLGRNIFSPNSSYQERREGWATNHVGEYGLIGTRSEDLATSPKIVIWGDSFVEAANVADPEKMHRQLNNLLCEDPETPGTSVAVGERYWSLADYKFRIPDYEEVLKDVRLHVIHLYSLEDTFPDQYSGGRISLFLSQPTFHLEKYDTEDHVLEEPKQQSEFANSLYRLHLHFFLILRTNLIKIARFEDLRFTPGTARPPAPATPSHRAWNRFLDPEWGSAEPPLEAWRYLLREFDAATEVPILFVYAPPTPALESGRLVTENPEKNLADHFSALCKEQGFGFTSLEEPFNLFLEENGHFPKGFYNSRPWEGHYNADGHRLAAKAIHNWIQQNHHVVYPD